MEVTKLSLLLKVLEGETADNIARQMDFFHVRALPDLGENIRCGNSLVESDFYSQYALSVFTDDEQVRINVFDWEAEFDLIEKAGGFDCVIGNPPYLYSAAKDYPEYFSNHFSFSQYQTDYYVYFIEKGLSLLKDGGLLGLIITDSWLNSDSFSVMRNALVSKTCIQKICTFGFKVFKKANIENTIIVASKKKPKKEISIVNFESPSEFSAANTLRVKDIKRLGIIDPNYTEEGDAIVQLLDKLPKLGRKLILNRGIHVYRTDGYGKTAFGKGPQTKRDKEERSYHSPKKVDKTCLPEIRGRDVFWFNYDYSGQYVSYGDWLAEPRDPKFIQSPKIVFRKTLGTILSAAYIEEPAAIDQALYIAIHEDNDEKSLKFVLGIAASAIGAWYLRTKYSIYDKLHPWYTKKQLEEFPIPEYSQDIVDIVDKILSVCVDEENVKDELGKKHLKKKKDIFRDELNKTVFRAYGLSQDQGAFIVSSVKGKA